MQYHFLCCAVPLSLLCSTTFSAVQHHFSAMQHHFFMLCRTTFCHAALLSLPHFFSSAAPLYLFSVMQHYFLCCAAQLYLLCSTKYFLCHAAPLSLLFSTNFSVVQHHFLCCAAPLATLLSLSCSTTLCGTTLSLTAQLSLSRSTTFSEVAPLLFRLVYRINDQYDTYCR